MTAKHPMSAEWRKLHIGTQPGSSPYPSERERQRVAHAMADALDAMQAQNNELRAAAEQADHERQAWTRERLAMQARYDALQGAANLILLELGGVSDEMAELNCHLRPAWEKLRAALDAERAHREPES